MPQVQPAMPYRPHALPHGKRMLVRQMKFPETYSDQEPMLSRSSDQLDPIQMQRVFAQFIGVSGNNLAHNAHVVSWFRTAAHIRVKMLIEELLDPEVPIFWSGYRVTATVGDVGEAIWHFELFSKRDETQTMIYTGDNAPNVLPAS